MANYLPTRADQLQPGDVVRVVKGVYEIGVKDSRACLVDLISSSGAWIGTYLMDDLIDKRVYDAPGERNE